MLFQPKKNISSLKLWLDQIRLQAGTFCIIMLCIFIMIPLSLCILVLIPYFIQAINSEPSLVTWQKLFGQQIAHWIQPLVASTSFHKGIPLSFQKSWFALIFIVTSAAYGLLNFYSDYLLRDLGEKLARKLRTDIIKKYLSLTYYSATSIDAGFLASSVGEDMREIQQTFTRLISSLLKDGLISLVFLVWLVLLDPQLFILFLTVLVPAGIVLRVTAKKLKNLSKQGLQFESDLLSGLLERMRGWQTIQVHKAIPYEIKKFNKINDKIYHVWRRATRAKTLGSPLVEWLGIIAATLLVITALRRITEGSLSSQILMSFMVTVGFLSDKINRMTNQLNTTRKGTEALHRIRLFLLNELPERKKLSSSSNAIATNSQTIQSVELNNLSIGHSSSKILMKDIHLKLSAGSLLVIVGPSGAGKSTFIKTALGLQPPINGELLINGKKVDESIYQHFSSSVCFIPQEPFLFQGTIFDNIIYPNLIEHPTQNDFIKAEQALALSFLEKDLQDSITGLSGGEKQRLMFARIFYRNPSLIVIDEGTSAIDLYTELKIIDNLKNHVMNSITIVVAHRPAIRSFATDILDFT